LILLQAKRLAEYQAAFEQLQAEYEALKIEV